MQTIDNGVSGQAPLMVRIKPARALLGHISNTTIWKWIGEGRVEIVYVDKMPFVTVESIHKLVASATREKTAQNIQ